MPREIILAGPREIKFSDYVDKPDTPWTARLTTLFSGVSHGTEMLLYRGDAPKFRHRWDAELRHFQHGEGANDKPLALGYETVARVDAIGSEVGGLARGDVIWIDAPHRQTHSVDMRAPPPYWRFAGISDYKHATFFALCRVALGAVHDADPVLGSVALVHGMGVVGLLCVQLLRRSGVRTVFALDRSLERLEIARGFGAIPIDTGAGRAAGKIKEQCGGVDFAIEASGAYEGLATAIRCVAPMGKVVVVSSYGNQDTGVHLGHEFHRNRITLVSSMTVNGCPSARAPLWSLDRLNREAAALLCDGSLDIAPMITSLVPFSAAVAAYKAIDNASSPPLKVIFDYDDNSTV